MTAGTEEPGAPQSQTPLVRSGTLTLAIRVVIFGLGLVSNVILARALAPQGRGLYALALVAPSAVTLIANLGISQALVYYLAKRTYTRDRLIGQVLALSLLLGGAATLGLFAVAAVAGGAILPGVPLSLVIIAGASIPLALFFYYSLSFEQGLENFVGFNAIYVVNAIALVVLLAPLVVAKGNVTLAVTAWSLSWIPTAATGVYVLSRSGRLNARLDLSVVRTLLRFGIVGYLSFMTNYLNLRLSTFLVNIFTNATQVGYYAVAVTLAETVWYMSTAASTVLAPRVAGAEGDAPEITTARVSRVVLWTSAAAAVVLAVAAPLVVRVLFGSAFNPSVVAVWLLLPGIITLSVARVLSSYLLGKNRLKVDLSASLAGLVVTLALDVLLIPLYGFAGAAIASSVAYTTTMAVNFIGVVRSSQLSVRDLVIPTVADVRDVSRLLRFRAGRPA
jgi:O-antigen/teichoic acid export membrane protein